MKVEEKPFNHKKGADSSQPLFLLVILGVINGGEQKANTVGNIQSGH